MRTIIIGDSPDFELEEITRLKPVGDLVIALDGAEDKLPSRCEPHIVCGDFDSRASQALSGRFPQAEYILLEDQHRNDLEKSIELALDRGATSIALCCVLGGRMDHSMVTISTLARFHRRIPIVVHHGGMEYRVSSPEVPVTLLLEAGTLVSTIPLGTPALVTLAGVRYPLTQSELRTGSHGVSNEAIGGDVVLRVDRGEVLVCHKRPVR